MRGMGIPGVFKDAQAPCECTAETVLSACFRANFDLISSFRILNMPVKGCRTLKKWTF